MTKGKIGAQVSHAVLKTIKNFEFSIKSGKVNLNSHRYKWDNKIKLFAVSSEKQLFSLVNNSLPNGLIKDGGHTQVAPGTYTELGLLVPETERISDDTKELI